MAKANNSNNTKGKPPKLAKTLRDIVELNSECRERFLEAEKLAKSIHNDEGRYTALPYFTRHGVDHCIKLEEFANNIIWRSEQFADNEFKPSPEEAMYLLSAIWLHDVGMMYRIFDGEDPAHLADEDYANKIRDEHEQRTVKYIHQKWSFNCNWNDKQKVLLGNICFFHRKKYPIAEFDPITEKSSYGYEDIRLAALASLLRLVDGCHIDQSRAPLALLGLYRSVGMSLSHALHWERANLITDVEFDHENREIVIIANCPKPFKFYGGEFDLKKVVNIIQKDVIKELESVQSVLLPWSNLFFLKVTIQTRIVKSLEYLYKDQYFALWPYLVQDTRSSTEASAAFVQLVLLTLDIKDILWVNEVRAIIVEIRKLRPLDFMLINLCTNIESLLGKDHSEDQIKINLRSYLASFQITLKENCDKIIAYAIELVVPESILFVFGYSMNIERILREVSTKIRVIMVDCFEPVANGFLDTENIKTLSIIKESGVKSEDIQFIQLYSFPHILSNLSKENQNITLLLGTHGVLDNKDLLCKVGSTLLAICAIEYGAQVIAFAEKSKFLSPDINQHDREVIRARIAHEEIKHHPGLGIPCVEPKMDVVSHDFVNMLITEDGNLSLNSREQTKLRRTQTVDHRPTKSVIATTLSDKQ